MPEDRRCIEVDSEDWLVLRLRWAFKDTRLVLMVWGTAFLLNGSAVGGRIWGESKRLDTEALW
jgi:hypothetical protein